MASDNIFWKNFFGKVADPWHKPRNPPQDIARVIITSTIRQKPLSQPLPELRPKPYACSTKYHDASSALLTPPPHGSMMAYDTGAPLYYTIMALTPSPMDQPLLRPPFSAVISPKSSGSCDTTSSGASISASGNARTISPPAADVYGSGYPVSALIAMLVLILAICILQILSIFRGTVRPVNQSHQESHHAPAADDEPSPPPLWTKEAQDVNSFAELPVALDSSEAERREKIFSAMEKLLNRFRNGDEELYTTTERLNDKLDHFDSLITESENLMTENCNLKHEIATCKTNAQALESKLHESKATKTGLNTEIDKLRAERRSDSSKISELEAKNTGLSREKADLDKKLIHKGQEAAATAKKHAKDVAEKTKKLDDKIDQLEKDLKAKSEGGKTSTKENAALKAELEKTKKDSRHKEENVQKLNGTVAELQKRMKQKENELATKTKAETDLTAKIAGLEARHALELEQRVDSLTSEHDAELKRRLTELSSRHEHELAQKIATLTSEHDQKIAALTSEHDAELKRSTADLTSQHNDKLKHKTTALSFNHEQELGKKDGEITELTGQLEVTKKLLKISESRKAALLKEQQAKDEAMKAAADAERARYEEALQSKDEEFEKLKAEHKAESLSLQNDLKALEESTPQPPERRDEAAPVVEACLFPGENEDWILGAQARRSKVMKKLRELDDKAQSLGVRNTDMNVQVTDLRNQKNHEAKQLERIEKQKKAAERRLQGAMNKADRDGPAVRQDLDAVIAVAGLLDAPCDEDGLFEAPARNQKPVVNLPVVDMS
ncbi:hypothetical protein H2200_003815 [Cladophialophora chaetospira]|uniref:Uncharacterized protein n=1 Tax=Cladophialophora chaetospira TaxID=386627 RepID=A0AA38XEX2_9EURO|nr:hypothetical protein H2200_003815 [Cladophialophora chaetospira]